MGPTNINAYPSLESPTTTPCVLVGPLGDKSVNSAENLANAPPPALYAIISNDSIAALSDDVDPDPVEINAILLF